MPIRRFRKKPAKRPRRYIRRRKPMISKPLRPATLPLVRDITHFVNTGQGALPTNWAFGTAGTHYNTVQCNQKFHLSQLDATTEFTNLFKMYKLNCVIVTITPLHNTSQGNGTHTSTQTYFGGSILGYSERNVTGETLDTAIEQSYWDQRPSKKTISFVNGKPRSFKIYPKILSEIYLSEGNTQRVPKKSGWLPTTTLGQQIPHYGLNMQFSWMDPNMPFHKLGLTPATAAMNFRVNYKYLMQFKGLK